MLTAFTPRVRRCGSPRQEIRQVMVPMSATPTLIAIGAAIHLCPFAYAPVSADFAGRDRAFIGGIGTGAHRAPVARQLLAPT